MKTTSLFWGFLFLLCGAVSYWNLRFSTVPVLILLMFAVTEFYARPGKKNMNKARKFLAAFEKDVDYGFNDKFKVNKRLDKYSVRHLCYLRDGIKWQIVQHNGSDLSMSLREEQVMDEIRRDYEGLLVEVEKRIPKKYLN